MKKLVFSGLLAVISMMQTSCLDGGNTQTQTGTSIGVIETNITGRQLIRIGNGTDYSNYAYTTGLTSSGLIDGDCILFGFHIDYGSDENVNAATYGYLTLAVTGFEMFNSNYYTMPTVTDTTTLITNEITITQTEYIGCLSNKLFLAAHHGNVLTNQKRRYEMSYNLDEEPVTDNQVRRYNLYLRAMEADKGKTPTINDSSLETFDIATFVENAKNKEKAARGTEVYIRINYVSTFNSDSTKISKWSFVDPQYAIAAVSENQN